MHNNRKRNKKEKTYARHNDESQVVDLKRLANQI